MMNREVQSIIRVNEATLCRLRCEKQRLRSSIFVHFGIVFHSLRKHIILFSLSNHKSYLDFIRVRVNTKYEWMWNTQCEWNHHFLYLKSLVCTGFFVTKVSIKLPTRSHTEWDLNIQYHALPTVGSGTFWQYRVGGATPTWGFPRVALSLCTMHSVVLLWK